MSVGGWRRWSGSNADFLLSLDWVVMEIFTGIILMLLVTGTQRSFGTGSSDPSGTNKQHFWWVMNSLRKVCYDDVFRFCQSMCFFHFNSPSNKAFASRNLVNPLSISFYAASWGGPCNWSQEEANCEEVRIKTQFRLVLLTWIKLQGVWCKAVYYQQI